MNTEHERIKFEAACHRHAEEAGHEGAAKLERDGDGYADPATQAAWWGWREARAALQSQDREDAGYESGRRCGLGFAHSVVSEILRKHYHGSGVEGLNKLIQQAADVIATEMDNPTTATTDIDRTRRIEGEGK